jgi:prophage antirepressor-like protein
MPTNALTKISIFNEKQIRKILFNNEWHFSVVDVCAALVESPDPGAYWRKLKQRLVAEGSEVVKFCHGLKLTAPDGKKNAHNSINSVCYKFKNLSADCILMFFMVLLIHVSSKIQKHAN